MRRWLQPNSSRPRLPPLLRASKKASPHLARPKCLQRVLEAAANAPAPFMRRHRLGRGRATARRPPAASRHTPVDAGARYLKPCRWTMYHSPRHEIIDVTSSRDSEPFGFFTLRPERSTR